MSCTFKYLIIQTSTAECEMRAESESVIQISSPLVLSTHPRFCVPFRSGHFQLGLPLCVGDLRYLLRVLYSPL